MPHGECRLEVFADYDWGLVEHGIDQRQSDHLSLSTRCDGAEQARLAIRKPFVDLAPQRLCVFIHPDWLVETLRLDPHPPDVFLEELAECHYLLREYDAMIEIYMRWQNPPLHMYTQLAAAYAQLGRMDEARDAFETYQRLRPTDADFAYYLAAHLRLCKRQEDADHWVEGYRKAGFEV